MQANAAKAKDLAQVKQAQANVLKAIAQVKPEVGGRGAGGQGAGGQGR